MVRRLEAVWRDKPACATEKEKVVHVMLLNAVELFLHCFSPVPVLDKMKAETWCCVSKQVVFFLNLTWLYMVISCVVWHNDEGSQPHTRRIELQIL